MGRDPAWIILRSAHWIVLVALVIAGAAYGISKIVTPVYSSTVAVGVRAAPVSGVSDAATGSNDLASQYAQLATTPAVIAAAAAAAGASASDLQAQVSAGTVNAQNVVDIKAQASTADAAATRANAVAQAFVSVVRTTNAQQAAQLASQMQQELGGDATVRAAQQSVAAAESALASTPRAGHARSDAQAQLTAAQNRLSTLISSHEQAISVLEQQTAAAQPTITVLGSAGPGSLVAPRPTLYAVIAFVVGLLIAAQLFVVFRRPAAA